MMANPFHLTRRRVARDVLVVVGLAWFIARIILGHGLWWNTDALAYWAVDSVGPYGGVLGRPGAFAYAPALAQVFVLLGHLPQAVFLVAWTAVNVAVAAWLVRPYPWAALILAVPLADHFVTGQIELLLTAAIVLGFRYPATWALVILAKVSPGVGLVWFVVRREWRSLAIGLGATAIIAAGSFAMAPAWWTDWVAFLGSTASGNTRQMPLARVGLALLLLVWGARSNRRWTVVVAAMLALPVIYIHSLAMHTGCVRLARGSGTG